MRHQPEHNLFGKLIFRVEREEKIVAERGGAVGGTKWRLPSIVGKIAPMRTKPVGEAPPTSARGITSKRRQCGVWLAAERAVCRITGQKTNTNSDTSAVGQNQHSDLGIH